MHVTSVEIAQLPLFCWTQFAVPNTQGDEFRIRDCGYATNHYCPALIALMRARGSGVKRFKIVLLGGADTDVRYTERAIADYPKCSIRAHVDATRQEIDRLYRMYGVKPVTTKCGSPVSQWRKRGWKSDEIASMRRAPQICRDHISYQVCSGTFDAGIAQSPVVP